MTTHLRSLFVLIFFATSVVTLSAQYGMELGIGGGVSHYFGDINRDFDLGKPGPAATVFGRYNFNERLSGKLGLSYGMVYGDDSRSTNAFQQARNLSFRSPVIDGTLQMEFNFLPYIHGDDERFFTPYLLGGFSIAHYNPEAEYRGEWVELRPLGTEGQLKGEEYYTLGGALVYGAGFKIDLSYEWSINIEVAAHRMFSDYLDDVSTVFTDLEDLERQRGELAAALADRSLLLEGVNEEGELSLPGRQRGNPNSKDSYTFATVSIVYYLGDLRCPKVSNIY